MPIQIEETLIKLKRSPFRSRFKLKEKDIEYIREKGLSAIRIHAEEFIRKRLAQEDPSNDGKQTPMRGHPVFIAQHATACCCRDCLAKWHRIPKGRALSEKEQQEIVELLLAWIREQYGPQDR